MKPQCFLFVLVLFGKWPLSAQNIPSFTHYISQFSSSPSQPLTANAEGFRYFDSNGHLYQTKNLRWNGFEWLVNDRSYYTVDAQGLLLEQYSYLWNEDSAKLINFFHANYGYHANGQLNFTRSEYWNSELNIWELNNIQKTTFSPENKILEYSAEIYYNGLVTSGYRDLYTYDTFDRVQINVHQVFNNGAWENRLKTEYFYNGMESAYSEALSSNWNEFNQVWYSASTRVTQTTMGNQKVLLTEAYSMSTWNASLKQSTTYTPNGYYLNYSEEEWDEFTNTWTTNRRSEWEYHMDQTFRQLDFVRETNSPTIYLQNVTDFDNGVYIASNQIPIDVQSKITVSPNPTVNMLQVEVEGEAKLTLFDSFGRIVLQCFTSSNKGQLSLLGNPSGLYTLCVEQNGRRETLQILKN